MEIFLACFALSCLFYALARWRSDLQISNDGEHYLRMGICGRAASPYHRRWLLPFLLKGNLLAWTLVSQGSLVLTGALVGVYAGQGTLGLSLVATALFCSLCAVWSLNACLRVMADTPMLALALGAALLSLNGHTTLALCLALIAGAVKEPGPVLAACFARDPALLAGLFGVNWFWAKVPAPVNEPWLSSPVLSARTARDMWDLKELLLPWGLLSILFVLGMDSAPFGLFLGALCALAVSHAQLLVAIDTVRLTQLAAPGVIAVGMYAPSWALALAVLTTGFVSHMYKGT